MNDIDIYVSNQLMTAVYFHKDGNAYSFVMKWKKDTYPSGPASTSIIGLHRPSKSPFMLFESVTSDVVSLNAISLSNSDFLRGRYGSLDQHFMYMGGEPILGLHKYNVSWEKVDVPWPPAAIARFV